MTEGPDGGKRNASTTKKHKGVEGLAVADLSAKWNIVVEALETCGVKIINPNHALEGALTIR